MNIQIYRSSDISWKSASWGSHVLCTASYYRFVFEEGVIELSIEWEDMMRREAKNSFECINFPRHVVHPQVAMSMGGVYSLGKISWETATPKEFHYELKNYWKEWGELLEMWENEHQNS